MAARKITARYTSACRNCGETIRYPEEVYWAKGYGVWHLAHGPEPAAEVVAKPLPVIALEAGAGRLYDLFRKVEHSGKKRPRLVLRIEDPEAGKVKAYLHRAGTASKFPGVVNVKAGYRWLGRIHEDGRWEHHAGKAPPTALVEYVAAICDDPAAAIARYGALTGNCMMCGLKLDTPESTTLGYGPVCAKRWGLPHGKAAMRAALKKEAA